MIFSLFASIGVYQAVVTDIILERGSHMKGMMELNGVSPLQYWSSWAVTYGLYCLFLSIAMVVVAHVNFPNAVTADSFWPLVFACYLNFAALISISFAVSRSFVHPGTATVVGDVLLLAMQVRRPHSCRRNLFQILLKIISISRG